MQYDLIVVGAGFGGSLMAMVAQRLGKSVLLLERGSHPRFAIGESTSPLMNLLIEEIAHTYDLPRLLPLATYGAWKAAYPALGVGLKRGFTYYEQPFRFCPERTDQLAVAASPGDACADTHWLRADVDHFLGQEAVALGVDYREHVALEGVEQTTDGWRFGDDTAPFLIDASGPQGFLHRRFGWREVGFTGYPKTHALYSHFTGVGSSVPIHPSPSLAAREGEGGGFPYPLDAAASHHVFDGGWMWVLPFDHGVTSAGIAVEHWLTEELNLAEGNAAAWGRFLERFPLVQAQFAEAQPVERWYYSPQLSFRTERAVGPNCALLPSAVGFIDPLFSTGMPTTLLGIQRLGALLATGLTDDSLAAYEATTFEELDWVAEFIAAHYACFGSFEHFAALTMYYFAAASYAELLRRLGQHDDSFRFLSARDPRFREGIAWCRANSRAPLSTFQARVAADIAHKNVAGLADPSKRNWYGIDLEDVVRAANTFGLTEAQLRQVIATAAWAQC